jgi:hypothetical protein
VIVNEESVIVRRVEPHKQGLSGALKGLKEYIKRTYARASARLCKKHPTYPQHFFIGTPRTKTGGPGGGQVKFAGRAAPRPLRTLRLATCELAPLPFALNFRPLTVFAITRFLKTADIGLMGLGGNARASVACECLESLFALHWFSKPCRLGA